MDKQTFIATYILQVLEESQKKKGFEGLQQLQPFIEAQTKIALRLWDDMNYLIKESDGYSSIK